MKSCRHNLLLPPTSLSSHLKLDRTMRVQCATYNGHLGEGQSVLPGQSGKEEVELASWLNATLARDGKGESDAPDLVAVGFQEMIPLVRTLLLSVDS